MAKNYDIVVLLDCYGDMLTLKQKSFIEYYYNNDLSLSEIAENEGITRQGVRDAIKRAESILVEMESRLGLAKKLREYESALALIQTCIGNINEYNMRVGLSREINDNVTNIMLAIKKVSS